MNEEVIRHYDLLIDEKNDPVYDPPKLREYMDKWDGERFINLLNADKTKSVLEIGIGTGRLAVQVAPLCRRFTGIDISPKTAARAVENLTEFKNTSIICADFMTYNFTEKFDIVYSSLTFMHIKNKLAAIRKISGILNSSGIFLVSLDKNRAEFIDMGSRKIKIYPDNPTEMLKMIELVGLQGKIACETEFAHILLAEKI